MGLLTSSFTLIFQNNKDAGDNIANDKIINEYRKLAPESLHITIDQIFSDCRERKTEVAKIRLQTIKATGALDAESEIILDMVSIRLNILEGSEKTKVHSSIISFIGSSTDCLTRDLYLATLIQLDAENNRIDDARERYHRVNQPGIYTQETFYELVASSKELEEAYESKRINLGESQLVGLIRGSFRTDNLALSLTVTNRLHDVFPTFNSKVLLLMAKARTLFNINLLGKSFWTITAKLKAEVMVISKEVSTLIDESSGKDPRLLDIAALYIQYSLGADKKLSNLCWKYVDDIEKIHPEIAAILHNINANDASKFTDAITQRYAKTQHDEEYRSQLLSEILSSKEISTADFVILRDYSSKNKINQWAQSGGIVFDQVILETDFRNIQLSLIALPNKSNGVQIENIRVQIENFIIQYHAQLSNINPLILLELTDNLLEHIELSSVTCDLIKPILPASDYWLSPIVKCYLNALLMSQQLATLEIIISGIDQYEWDSFLWIIQACIHEQENDYKNAIVAIEKALDFNPNSEYSWHLLVCQYRNLKVSNEKILSVLKRIPDSVFLKKSNLACHLLYEMATTAAFPRVERIILSWFVEAPNACAIIMSDSFFNFSISTNNFIPASEKVGDCVVGVQFKKDNEILTKLLVDNEILTHNCLMNVNSPLGEMLLNMDLNEVRRHGIHEIELLERLPPYIAALRISIELRHIQNDGSDCFYAFHLPDKPDELVALFERLLCPYNDENNNIIQNSEIPLIAKGQFLHPNAPVKGALELLTTKKSYKSLLPNFGEESVSEVVLDVYSISYLVLTGLAFGINDSSIRFIITEETKNVIEEWLQEVNDGNHGSLGIYPEGGLWIQTAQDIKQSTQLIREGLQFVVSKTEVVTPLLIDLPPALLQIRNIIDYSVYSSIKLSISNNIPWLSMDGFFTQLFISSGFKVVNAYILFCGLGRSLNFEQKKEGLYLYAMETIPYPLTFQDLYLLSGSGDEYAHYHLAKIILLHPDAYTDTTIAVDYLSMLLASVLTTAYLNGQFSNGLRTDNPSNNGYAEKVFNLCSRGCIQCGDGIEAELAFSMLLCRLFDKFQSLIIKLICIMASKFALGHFLCIEKINTHIQDLQVND